MPSLKSYEIHNVRSFASFVGVVVQWRGVRDLGPLIWRSLISRSVRKWCGAWFGTRLQLGLVKGTSLLSHDMSHVKTAYTGILLKDKLWLTASCDSSVPIAGYPDIPQKNSGTTVHSCSSGGVYPYDVGSLLWPLSCNVRHSDAAWTGPEWLDFLMIWAIWSQITQLNSWGWDPYWTGATAVNGKYIIVYQPRHKKKTKMIII